MNEAPAGRQVPLGHLLTVVHKRLFCVTGGPGVQGLLTYMTQFPVVGPQIQASWPVCRYALVRQHRWLLTMPLPALYQDQGWAFYWAWLDRAEQLYGPAHPVDPCTDEDWRRTTGETRAPMMLDQQGARVHFDFVNPILMWAH